MGKVNGSGTNWSKHNGGDNAMSLDEFENFWKEEVKKNREHRNGKMDAADEKLIRDHKDTYLASDGNISESEFNTLVSYYNNALAYTEGDIPSVPSSSGSESETGASLKYIFDLTKLQDDLDILDVEDGGADDDLIYTEAVINSYIDEFNKANPGMSDKELAHVKEIAKTMTEDGNSIWSNELYSLLTLMKNGKKAEIDIMQNPFSFDIKADFHYLDANDGTDDDEITISNMDLTAYIDAFHTAKPGMEPAELQTVKDIAKTMIEDGGTIDWAELEFLLEFMERGQTANSDIVQNPFSFDASADFEYLDAKDGTDDNKITISNTDLDLDAYIDAFNTAYPGMTASELANVKDTTIKYGVTIERDELLKLLTLMQEGKKAEIDITEEEYI